MQKGAETLELNKNYASVFVQQIFRPRLKKVKILNEIFT